MKRYAVIFVCTGNTCRSPMAEGILKDLILDEAGRHHVVLPIEVLSAGIQAIEGQPASRLAVEVAAGYGIGLRLHRARRLDPDTARNADLILTMERGHTDYIRSRWPGIRNVFELKRYGREDSLPGPGIADPAGGGIAVYRAVFDELREEVTRVAGILFPKIIQMYSLA